MGTTKLPDFILFGPRLHLSELNPPLLWWWRQGPLPDALWRRREPDAVFVFFSNFFLPSCFRHTALPQTRGSDGNGHGSDFLWVWGLLHCGALSPAMCRVHGVYPVRSSLSLCLPLIWYYCSVVGYSEGRVSWWRSLSPMKSLSTPFCFSIQRWTNLDGRFCYIAEITFNFLFFSCIKKPSNLGG